MRLRPTLSAAALLAAFVVHAADRRALGGDEPAAPARDESPTWLREALAEMKATSSPGVALVLPPDKDGREALRKGIESLLRDGPFEAQMHLVEAVYVVVEGRHVGAQAGETAVLLDCDGKRVAGRAVSLAAAAFAPGVRPLLRDGGRLAARAKAARTPDVEKALAGLGSEDPAKIDAAVAWLAQRFATAGPAVIEAWEAAKEGDVKLRLSWAIGSAFGRRRGDQGTDGERPLPFGTRWRKSVVAEPERDPCPACGMMIIRPRSSDVLELLAKDDGTAK